MNRVDTSEIEAWTLQVVVAIRCLHEELIGDVGSAVVFVFDYMQGGKRELLREAPDHTERRRNVEPATNEHRRNIGDAVEDRKSVV